MLRLFDSAGQCIEIKRNVDPEALAQIFCIVHTANQDVFHKKSLKNLLVFAIEEAKLYTQIFCI